MKKGRKSNKQLVKEKLKTALTVKKLIEKLQQLPQDYYVGRVGHFGEFYPLEEYDVRAEIPESSTYITPLTNRSREYREKIKVVTFDWPDIGPEPN